MLSQASTKFLVFIDPAVDDYQSLVKGVVANTEVIVLDSQRDGVEQITEALRDRPTPESIHIVSHGSPGALYLGNSQLNLRNLAHYADDLAGWAAPQLLLYGCNVAAGDAGSEFIETLSTLTGAAIAASTSPIGNAALGGNWQLDVTTHNVPVALAFNQSVEAWQGILPATINPTGGNLANGSDGLRVILTNDGSFQIFYKNSKQVFGTNASTTAIGIGGATVGSSYGSFNRTWDNLSQTAVTGAGSQADPFAVTTRLFDDIDNDNIYDVGVETQLDYTVSYVSGNPYLAQTFRITAPTNNTQVFKLYQGMDTLLAGGDAGPAYGLNSSGTVITGTTDTPVLIGTVKNLGQPTESFLSYVQSGRAWDSWSSGGFSTQFGQVNNGGNLIKTYDTNASTDNGIGVQYNLGVATGVVTIRNLLTFNANTAIGLATNNTPTTTGTTQTLTYAPNGAAVDFAAMMVTDPDATDTITASFTLSNSSAGSLASSAGGTYNAVTGIWSISGTTTLVNAALDVLQFTPASGFSQTASIAARISDGIDIIDTTIPLQANGNTTAPAVPSTGQLDVASDSGNSNNDRLTNDTTPTFTGTNQPGNTVELFAGSVSLGTALVNAAGRWSLTPTSVLADGTYQITLRAISPAGFVSASSPAVPLTIDTRPATAAILEIDQPLRDSGANTLTLRFSEAVRNADPSDLALTLNGQAVPLVGATLTTTDNITWTLGNIPGLTQASGNYQIGLKAGNDITDLAGNALAIGNTESWLTGYTSDAKPSLGFTTGKKGLKVRDGGGGNVLKGKGGKDSFNGGGGNDRLLGRGGSDKLKGGAGKDRLGGGGDNDQLFGGGGADRLKGKKQKDRLVGGAGNDVLIGGGGNDVLVGGKGRDLLTGSNGNDSFTFNTLKEAGDRITDFNSTNDLIDVRGIFKAPQFGGDNRFAQYHQFIQLVQVGANTEVKVDTDGKGAGTAFTTLMTLQNVTVGSVKSTNFVVG